MEAYYNQAREENQRMKIIIKQMKKELEDVYVRVEDLKKIEGDREKLINEVNQS